jgi:hypothetical protein
MPVVNYDTIEPNVAEVDIVGSLVEVTWKCPTTNKIVAKSSAPMNAVASTSDRVQKSVKRAATYEFFRYLAGMMSSILPGASGRIARTAVNTAGFSMERNVVKARFDENSERNAVVLAFDLVKNQFRWDEDREQFVSAK